MISDEFGPNVGKEANDFFQSDRDLMIQQQQQLKKEAIGMSAGDPKQIPSKVLAFEFANILDGDQFYVAESGHVARKFDLQVRNLISSFG